ncbi:protein WHAT'S THIS FACTOR 9, mitochondrial [Sesamum alatum]|uniref:Protein WHAT'S THIS FACTOR 9, mitochondrial n=1 Tax=Sesamum alatum TaxID=300844 RepID=A0AAE1XJU5_9LAMI|nr:protein WHAT'S THIS FACTOR 9, mitochondrial [Sesamum alatum]
MHFLHRCRSASVSRRGHHHHHIRTLYDAVSSLRCPRDRGLDHAVERERHLKPLLNLKNLIISEPSKSVPLSLIADSKERLGIPFRPIEFIRKYPSIFQEFHPGSLNIQPHIKLTPEIVSLNSEENLLYQSVDYKQDIAGRLLKLLMISRINKIPIVLLERLKWELGLPQDYEKDIIPEFPDYFRVINGNNFGGNSKVLELVCWSDEFAVSELEKKGAKDGKVQFSLQYSKGFEMDKKYKKWVDEWQKLPYVSPYENATHLATKTDESDKWAVAVLHEVLNLFVGKKAERDSLLSLGECFGLRARFKCAMLQHPGIFYVSSKIGTYTVVLRDAYKRGMLIERHPLVNMRFKYVQLMNVVKDEEKPKSTENKTGIDVKKGGEESEDGETGEEDNAEMYDSSDDDESDDSEEAFQGENVTTRGKFKRKGAPFEEKNTRRSAARSANGRRAEENDDESDDSKEPFQGENVTARGKFKRKSSTFEEKNTRRSANGRRAEENVYKSSTRFSGKGATFEEKNTRRSANGRRAEENVYKSSTRFSRKGATFEEKNTRRSAAFEEKNTRRSAARSANGRRAEENVYKSSTRFSRRTNIRGGDMNIPRRPPQKLDFSRNRASAKTEKARYRGNSAT